VSDTEGGAPRAPAPPPRAAAVAGWALLALAAALLAALVAVGFAGGDRIGFVHVPAPRRHALLAFAVFGAGVYLLSGAWRTRRALAEFAGRMLLLLFGFGTAFLAAETGLRVYLWRTQAAQSLDRLDDAAREIKSTHPLAFIVRRSADPALIFELKPNLDVDFGHLRVRTNRLGMREDREYPAARLPRSVRIAGIGDSGMFGWGVLEAESYLAVLEGSLAGRAGVTYEVLNFGVPGYNTRLEVEALRARVLPFRPDILIVGWCDNDFQVPFFVPQQGQWTRRDVSLLWLLLFNRARYSDVALSPVATLGRDAEGGLIPEDVRSGSDVGGVRAAFADLKRVADENGIKVLVFGAMRREAVEIVDSLGIPYFNTKERIPRGRYPADWHVNFMHPAPQGHRALAGELERELDRLGWLGPRADLGALRG